MATEAWFKPEKGANDNFKKGPSWLKIFMPLIILAIVLNTVAIVGAFLGAEAISDNK